MNAARENGRDAGRALAVVEATASPAIPAMPDEYPSIVQPLVTPEAASAAIDRYERLKTAIVRDDDRVTDKKGRVYLKKAFWRRVARCFGLSVELVREQRVVEADGTLRYSATYRAIAPNGQSMEGDGLCDSIEFGPTEHNVRAKAHTRAKNRAISDLVGGGEVSAEELPSGETDDYEQPARGGRGARQRTNAGAHDDMPTAPELRARLLATGDADKLSLLWARWWNETNHDLGKLLARVEKREAAYRRWVSSLRARAYDAGMVRDEEAWADLVVSIVERNDLVARPPTYAEWKRVGVEVETVAEQIDAERRTETPDEGEGGDEHRLDELEPGEALQ